MAKKTIKKYLKNNTDYDFIFQRKKKKRKKAKKKISIY